MYNCPYSIYRSCVAFSPKNRILGVAAKNQMVTNMKNTVFGFKRLLGRKFSDPYVQKELKHFPFKVEQRQDDGIGIRVNYLGEDNVFSPEQVNSSYSLALIINMYVDHPWHRAMCLFLIKLLSCDSYFASQNYCISFVTYYNDCTYVFLTLQITAMLLTKLKESATIALQTPINDCVISVPSYFTNAERNALLDAANIAGTI